MNLHSRSYVAGFIMVAILAGSADAGVIRVYQGRRIGQVIQGRTVTFLGEMFTRGDGDQSQVVGFSDGSTRIFRDGFTLFNDDTVPALDGRESSMGVSGVAGGNIFIYSPSVNGADAVYTSHGVLQKAGDAFPTQPGKFSTFNDRPRISDSGTAAWVGGWADTAGGATVGSALLKNATPANPAATSAYLSGGDFVSGVQIAPTGINLAYDIADNAQHYIADTTLVAPAGSDNAIVVNGSIAAREGEPTGQGGVWENFRFMGINSSGNYTICGDTSGGFDDFVTFNGTIAVREDDVVSGVTLGSTVHMVSIANDNKIAMIWDLADVGKGLFVGDGATLSLANLLLQTGDVVDTTGDGVGDFIIEDFNASATRGAGLDLRDDPTEPLDIRTIGVNVDMRPVGGGASIESIIQVVVPTPGAASILGAAGVMSLRRRRA